MGRGARVTFLSDIRWGHSHADRKIFLFKISPYHARLDYFGMLVQYRCYWCPGSCRRQTISSNDINYIKRDILAFPGSGSQKPVTSQCRKNDILCKRIFNFPRTDSVHKGNVLEERFSVLCQIITSACKIVVGSQGQVDHLHWTQHCRPGNSTDTKSYDCGISCLDMYIKPLRIYKMIMHIYILL